MSYSEQRMFNEDIDIFVKYNNKVSRIFLLSSEVPSFLINYDKEIAAFDSIVYDLKDITDIEVNPNLKKLLKLTNLKAYLSDFVEIAKKGIYVYDKNLEDNTFHLVAKPITNITIDQELAEINNDLPITFEPFLLHHYIK